MGKDDLAIIEALDAIERQRAERIRAQVVIAERLASIRAIVRNAADSLRRRQPNAGDPNAALSRLSWQLHEERVRADVDLERLRGQLEALASERAARLSQLPPAVAAVVAQLLAEGVRPLLATLHAGRCEACSAEANAVDASTQCHGCRRFVRGRHRRDC